jgi:hypothetical protein
MYDPLFALDLALIDGEDGFTVVGLEERLFVAINFKTWKLDLFMPKVVPNIRVISGPEIMYLEGERERERERGHETGKETQTSPESRLLHL